MSLLDPPITPVPPKQRTDKNTAKSVMGKISTDPEGRRNGSQVMADAIFEVNKLDPNKWGVVMYKNYPAIRLIIGGDFVCTIIENKIWFPLKCNILGVPPVADVDEWEGTYFDLTAHNFSELWSEIQPFFFTELTTRVRNCNKFAERSKGTHSSGVLDYLNEELSIALLTPGWLGKQNSVEGKQLYSSAQLNQFAQLVFKLYCNNFHQDYDLRYSYKPATNVDKINAGALKIGINEDTAKNYSGRLFNLFNNLSGNSISNGLAEPPPKLAKAGKDVYDDEALHFKHRMNEAAYNGQLSEQVATSAKLSKNKRRQRLAEFPAIPETIAVLTKQFKRNPHVITEVLSRANGVCETCGNDAPFIRKSDGTPYLEVHHKHPLAEGGPDTVENAIALCPNCHRKEHFG